MKRRKNHWPGRAATLNLIKSAAEHGVEIISLEDAPGFRFVPVTPEQRAEAERSTRDTSPTKISNVAYRCRRPGCLCKKARSGWRHAPFIGGKRYEVPMAGDPEELTEAKLAYQRGDPIPLRKWLADEENRRAL